MSIHSRSFSIGTTSAIDSLNSATIQEGPENVTIEKFMQEGRLKKIGAGFDVRVVANPDFPHLVVKEYNCERAKLKYLFDNEISALNRITERLEDEKLSRVVFPRLYGSEVRETILYEMFPRIYPPNAMSSEDPGEMVGISFSKKTFYAGGEYHHAGRGHIIEPPHLVKYFRDEVPGILKELGKAFALLHFKAFVMGQDVEVVIGKAAPLEPLKLFLIDFDRAGVCDFFSKEEYLSKEGEFLAMVDYFKYHYPFGKSFQEFTEVDEEFKTPFIQGYVETADTLGFRSEAEDLVAGYRLG